MPKPCLITPAALLLESVARESAKPVAPELEPIIRALRDRFGASLKGLLFYGSCLRGGDLKDGLIDLYVLIDNYSNADMGWAYVLASRYLPPSVFLIKVATSQEEVLRAKCAVITVDDFEKGTCSWFHSYLWSRFSQPSRLVYCSDEFIQVRIHHALSRAAIRMMSEALSVEHSAVSNKELWTHALSLTYASELRPEKAGRSEEIVQANGDYFTSMARGVIASVPALSLVEGQREIFIYRGDTKVKLYCRWKWKIRRVLGRTLNVLRLIAGLFTFDGAVDYALWKLERHLGEPVLVNPRIRQFPLIFCWPLLWRLLRHRKLR